MRFDKYRGRKKDKLCVRQHTKSFEVICTAWDSRKGLGQNRCRSAPSVFSTASWLKTPGFSCLTEFWGPSRGVDAAHERLVIRSCMMGCFVQDSDEDRVQISDEVYKMDPLADASTFQNFCIAL
jgi:hypothetical protein